MRALGVLSGLLAAYPAAALAGATDTIQPVAAQTKGESVVKTKVVCKQIAETGTRFKRKACGRKEDWTKLEDDSTRARGELGGAGGNTAKGE